MTKPSKPLATGLSWLFTLLEIGAICWALTLIGTLLLLVIGGPKSLGGAWGVDVALRLTQPGSSTTALSLNQTQLSIRHLHATIPIQFADAKGLINLLAFVTAGILLCKAGTFIALSDLFRRLFASAARREIFTAHNMGLLQKTGGLVILLTAAGIVFQHTAELRTERFIRDNITARGMIAIEPQEPRRTGWEWGSPAEWVHLNYPELIVGLVLLGLGEALRQGVALREDHELTV